MGGAVRRWISDAVLDAMRREGRVHEAQPKPGAANHASWKEREAAEAAANEGRLFEAAVRAFPTAPVATTHPLVALCMADGLPVPKVEHRFAQSIGRQWRFDYAWVAARLAVEVEGGIWRQGGGAHSHPSNIVRDIEKYNEAVLLGWRVLRVVPERLSDALPMIRRALANDYHIR